MSSCKSISLVISCLKASFRTSSNALPIFSTASWEVSFKDRNGGGVHGLDRPPEHKQTENVINYTLAKKDDLFWIMHPTTSLGALSKRDTNYIPKLV